MVVLGAWDTKRLAKVLVCCETGNASHIQKCKGIATVLPR